VFWTTRWRFLEHKLAEVGAGDRPVIFCSWHGRQFMMPKFWPVEARLSVLGSTSFDGQLALAIASQFGIDTITRQKSDLSPQTVRAILRVLKSGKSIGLTPDGSRGPRMNVNPGVIDLARISGGADHSRGLFLLEFDCLSELGPLPLTFALRPGHPRRRRTHRRSEDGRRG
jgi:lysophospholipid acyltransferase (LPLAT)-like uncharacterized protein